MGRGKSDKSQGAKPTDSAQPTSVELTDDQKQVLYFDRKRKIVSIRAKIASLTADLRNEYKGLKAELGITKKDVDFALSLEDDEDGQAMAEHRRRMTLARWEQHPIGSQGDLFSDVDLTPSDDIAYGAGKKAGLAGDPCRPDYDPSTSQYRRYMDGFHEGQAVLARGIKPTAPDVPTGSLPRDKWRKDLSEQIAEGDRAIRAHSSTPIGDAPATAEVH